jgi:hypothetical protein
MVVVTHVEMLEHDNSGRRRWRVEGRRSEGAANSNGPSPDEELWNRPSHVHKSQKIRLKPLTYFEGKKIATLCRENLHAKAEVGGQYFGEKGGRKEEGAGALPKLTPPFPILTKEKYGPFRGQITARNR